MNKPLFFITLFLAAFFVRAIVLYGYIQYEQRYCQADTLSYTYPALALYKGMGMVQPNNTPVFWRTPGYPLFIAPFYNFSDTDLWNFEYHEPVFKLALFVQILWCSLLPILLYLLAMTLTGSPLIAYILAAIGIVHPGFILASTYLLTDGPAQIFFVLYLLLLLRGHFITSALALSAYTWMRPMGQFVGIATILIIFLMQGTVTEKIRRSALFLIVFIASLSPWFIRNYQLTGQWYFCPLFGLYFNVFNAPKIRARIENIPHELAWKKQVHDGEQEVRREYAHYAATGNHKVICGEMICARSAMPWIMGHPFYFMYDWFIEVCKTTFDLYSYQFIMLYHNCFKWDPLVEYLPEKLADTLYRKELPWWLRLVAYAELVSEIALWFGIIAGFILVCGNRKFRNSYGALWVISCIMIGAVVCQTGGFGYARLRLPIEPLIIILGLLFWLYLTKVYRLNNNLTANKHNRV